MYGGMNPHLFSSETSRCNEFLRQFLLEFPSVFICGAEFRRPLFDDITESGRCRQDCRIYLEPRHEETSTIRKSEKVRAEEVILIEMEF